MTVTTDSITGTVNVFFSHTNSTMHTKGMISSFAIW